MYSVNRHESSLVSGMLAHKGTHRMAKFKHHRARNSNRMMAIWNVLLICYFIEIANNVALSIIAQSIEDNMGNKIYSYLLSCIYIVVVVSFCLLLRTVSHSFTCFIRLHTHTQTHSYAHHHCLLACSLVHIFIDA